MTINLANNNPRIEYSVAQGVTQTVFSVPFEFFDDSDLSVYVDGVLKAEGTDYTLTGGDGSTGTLTFVPAIPPAIQQVTGATGGSIVVIVRATAIERTSDFSVGADINRAALNEQLDILTAMVADAKDRTDRTIRLNPHEVASSLVLPSAASRKGKVLAFDPVTADVINGPTVDEVINAEEYAANAAASAAAALASETAAAASETAAASSESHAASSEAAAAASALAASNSETAAALSEANAAASEANAAISESAAAASAAAALASEVAAAGSESSAATSASNAASSASSAAASASAALTALDNFDDRYLGQKASDPTLDNDGNPLIAGSLYFNTTDSIMKVYTGSIWIAAYVSGEAVNIGFTPTGNVSALNVQNAIAEVDAEKVAKTSTSGSAIVPSGTTAQRDGSPVAGYLRFNSTLSAFEGYDGTQWANVGGSGVPAGAVSAFAQSSAPTGWLKANGAAVSRTTYAALFAAIGTTYGAGDGSTTFNLPDLRGEFIRGWDDGRGVDSGRALGSAQSSQNLSHTHGVTDPGHAHTLQTFSNTTGSGGAGSNPPQNQLQGGFSSNAAWLNHRSDNSGGSQRILSGTTGVTIANSGGTEARPRNVALLYCIKF